MDGYQYEYDYENRIVKITKDSNDIAEFAYDALRRRIEKKDLVDADNTRRYYYNYNWQVLAEYDSSDSFKDLFIYGNYIDEVLMMQGASGPSLRYYIHDHLYSPVAIANAFGLVFERYEYDAYGSCSIMDRFYNPRSESVVGNPYLFTGRRVDILDNSSLKIQYNRNRYYDYYTGRWLTHDPLGYLDSMNLYEYATSNPVVFLDSSGASVFRTIRMIIGICGRPEMILAAYKVAWAAAWTAPGAPYAVPTGGNPWAHCVWSCRMARAEGNNFARIMGEKKEALDTAVADFADTIYDHCWNKLPFGARWYLSEWVCSANQDSDITDNKKGRECVCPEESCEECCTRKDIPKGTPEGDAERPYGERCKGRYKKELEEVHGPIEVEY
jgi:RHS repeat-associated protein